MNLLINTASKQTLDAIKSELPQSLLLSGREGIGLHTIASWLAGSHLVSVIHPQDSKSQVDSKSGTITVEVIRQLYDQTRTKAVTPQIVIIDDADRMSSGAQAAFLKLLEEPNSATYFILTSHHPEKLLSTIRSRVQHTAIHPLSSVQSASHLASLGIDDPVKKAQLQFIAEGLPAELTRLVADEAYFQEHARIINDARDLLQADQYGKLLLIQKYKNNRDHALWLLESAMQILRRSISAKPQHTLIVRLEELLEVKERIANNYNVSLQLTLFVL